MSIQKTANVTISREFFDDLLRYFCYYKYNYYNRLSSSQAGVWPDNIFTLIEEYANLDFEGQYQEEIKKPTKEEMQQLNERIQKHIAEKLIAVGNREKYRARQFEKGNWKKK